MAIIMMERLVALGADYVTTIGGLARAELGHDAARIRAALRASAASAAVLAVGAVWLNVALLLWLLTTPHPIAGAAAIGAVALVAGLFMAGRARRDVDSLRVLESTRTVLAEEFGGRGRPADGEDAGRAPVAHPTATQPFVASRPMPVPIPTPAEARARLRAIREELRETVALHRGPHGEPVDEPVQRFEPRSRTMRAAMWLWRAIPRVPSGTAIGSALGLVAVGSPRLRRLLALLALLRNLGGHARSSAHGTASYPSSS
jgi:dihydroxyacetone kinase DhaKLM complex PTS-EIIA-like component DhaM